MTYPDDASVYGVDNSTDMEQNSSHDPSDDDDDDIEAKRLSRQLDGWYHELKSNVMVRVSHDHTQACSNFKSDYSCGIMQICSWSSCHNCGLHKYS